MSINTDVWGIESTWINDLRNNAKTTTKSMMQFVIDRDWILNRPVDPSPCYCGMRSDNYLVNAIFLLADKTAVNVFENTGDISNWFLIRNYADPPGEPYNMEIIDTSVLNRWSRWDAVTDIQTYYSDVSNHVVFNIKLNRLLLRPYVVCSDTAAFNGTDHNYELGDYVANYTETYRYIKGVYCVPYVNISEDDTPEWVRAQNSTDDYIFTAPLVKLTDDMRTEVNSDFEYTYSLFGRTGTNQRDFISILGFGATPIRDLIDSPMRLPIGLDPVLSHYIYDDNDNPTKVMYIRPYNTDLLNEIYKQISFYGMFFVGEGTGSITDLSLTSDRTYCGIIEDNGVTYGRWSQGTDNEDRQQFTWTDSSESPYDGTDPPEVDPNFYDGEMHTGSLVFFQTPTTKYNIAFNNFNNLCTKLWDALALLPAGDPLGDYCLDTFLTTNPIDSIIAVKYFPISEDLGFGSATTVKLGKFDTGIPAITAYDSIRKDCGSLKIFPRFGEGNTNWLDGLTTITLYLPFCGTVELNAAEYMDRTVNVEYLIDLNTGNCSAVVCFTADNGKRVITDIANGVCCIDLPVTGIQHMTLDSQLYNATEQLKSMRINNAVTGLNAILGLTSAPDKGLTGGISQLASTGAALYNAIHSENVAEYNLQHTQLPVKMIGTTGACTGAMAELYPTLIISRPDISGINNDAYAHVNGYACCKSGTIGSFKGYTQFSNADLSGFTATATEKDMILTALKSGVIL